MSCSFSRSAVNGKRGTPGSKGSIKAEPRVSGLYVLARREDFDGAGSPR